MAMSNIAGWRSVTLFILISFAILNLGIASSLKPFFQSTNSAADLQQATSQSLAGQNGISHSKSEPALWHFARSSSTDNSTAGQGSYTCGPGSPCTNGACCGSSGWCGYGPTYCGDGCQSNCNATAECGKYANPAGKTCPLNVCCSEFGFCGTTSEFCDSGCQSNCPQPMPNAPASNVQKRIVGYWEGWNSQHPCGTLSPGQIPATLLTHLVVAFAYISPNFDLTTMTGVSTAIYQSVGNVKSKNPDLKLLISVGGWDFTDAGSTQELFTEMVSSSSNRATFIKNVLAWLGEYGYDGIDFDWEYPGASERGGHPEDGANYAIFLQELRSAIKTGNKEYIVTFTAPTSYWYLQNFDIPNMVPYVDWVNLMSYDLHGVWDSSDRYIGSEVFAHTNLTEIDLALDLFWRVNVDPSDIVLGLGFYGRTYELSDNSCWKPGCPFLAAGAAGKCTNTAGILSYFEINQIIKNTGATPYVDHTAAVNYMVYNENNWVSFDDAATFSAKIEYANKMGLGGLMVWAIDLDDSDFSALRAITDSSALSISSTEFSLVPLEYLFPSTYLPLNQNTVQWGMTTFGAAAAQGSMDPSQTGFGFMLVAGDSYAVTSLNKRGESDREPFIFLDCPDNISEAPHNSVQTVRVVCLSNDVLGCFQIMERGVAGTIVEMPDNCARNRFARAISLQKSKDQQVPKDKVSKRSITSEVYDFSFDFDLSLARRDTNNTVMRLDVSNVPGYWNGLVNFPGIQNGNLNEIKARFFAPNTWDWSLRQDNWFTNNTEVDKIPVNENISAPIFWQTTGQGECTIKGSDFTEGVAVYVDGVVNATLSYGFSMIAEVIADNDENEVQPVQMSGFLAAEGEADVTYGVAGVGNFDIAQARLGNPAYVQGAHNYLNGAVTIDLNWGRTVSVKPYFQIDYELATWNGTDATGPDTVYSNLPFDGELKVRTVTDFGDFHANFPANDSSSDGGDDPSVKRKPTRMYVPKSNVLYGTSGNGGSIAIGTFMDFGLDVSMTWPGVSTREPFSQTLVDMSMKWNTVVESKFDAPDKDEVCSYYTVQTSAFQWVDDNILNWDNTNNILVDDSLAPTDEGVCYATYVNDGAASGTFPGWEYKSGSSIEPSTFLGDEAALFTDQKPKMKCRDCVSCVEEDDEQFQSCCGCVCMECIWGFSDLSDCTICNPMNLDGVWPNAGLVVRKFEEGWADDSTDVQYDGNHDSDFHGHLHSHQHGHAHSHLHGHRRSHSEVSADVLQLENLLNNTDGTKDLSLLGPRSLHVFDRRAAGTATLTTKKIQVCGRKVGEGMTMPYQYPSFPASPQWPWEGIQNNKWDAIARYYGNSSASCTSWAVDAIRPADQVYIGVSQTVRAHYQTEHVLEGQLLGDFFTIWLATGQVERQPQGVSLYSQQILTCQWTSMYITSPWLISFTVPYLPPSQAFINYVWTELGNAAHLDRLSLYLARQNTMKGRLFSQKRAIDPSGGYNRMPPEQQLLNVKEFGMAFEYMNHPNVWAQFCDTFEAIYARFQEFDTRYNNAVPIGQPPNLASEWATFIRATLDSIVVNGRDLLDQLYNQRSGSRVPLSIWEFHWFTIMASNKPLIRFPGTCTHLGPTTV